MKTPRFFSILAVTMLGSLSITMLSSACFAQTVSNVRFKQVNNKVKITYSLDKQADISVCVSEDGGNTWSSPLQQVSGDVGIDVQSGAKTIWWDALAEYEELVGSDICFRVVPLGEENITFTVNGQTFTMVYVQGGTFMMGGLYEGPIHQVTLSDYYIGKYEVTQGLWKAVLGNNPSRYNNSKKNFEDYPVDNVSWQDCQSFISKLNTLLSDQLGGKRFALPTEAQWEYAARGGNKSNGYKYAGSNLCGAVAWYPGNSSFLGLCDLYFATTRPVGKKKPNELGLYDMSGNIEEICLDWRDAYSKESLINPCVCNKPYNPRRYYHVTPHIFRVTRGGSFASCCKDMLCVWGRSDTCDSYPGLRLVLIP